MSKRFQMRGSMVAGDLEQLSACGNFVQKKLVENPEYLQMFFRRWSAAKSKEISNFLMTFAGLEDPFKDLIREQIKNNPEISISVKQIMGKILENPEVNGLAMMLKVSALKLNFGGIKFDNQNIVGLDSKVHLLDFAGFATWFVDDKPATKENLEAILALVNSEIEKHQGDMSGVKMGIIEEIVEWKLAKKNEWNGEEYYSVKIPAVEGYESAELYVYVKPESQEILCSMIKPDARTGGFGYFFPIKNSKVPVDEGVMMDATSFLSRLLRDEKIKKEIADDTLITSYNLVVKFEALAEALDRGEEFNAAGLEFKYEGEKVTFKCDKDKVLLIKTEKDREYRGADPKDLKLMRKVSEELESKDVSNVKVFGVGAESGVYREHGQVALRVGGGRARRERMSVLESCVVSRPPDFGVRGAVASELQGEREKDPRQ